MIDTSTIEGKIAVMQAYADGKNIERRVMHTSDWFPAKDIGWDWIAYEYRIRPQTLEEAATKHVNMLDDGYKWSYGDAMTAFRLGAKWAAENNYKGEE